MTKTPIRKFADIVTDKAKQPTESKVAKAFSDIKDTPSGRVIEQYFLHLMTLTPPVDAPDSAFRDNATQRRIAARIVRMMNGSEPGDGAGPTAGTAQRGRRKPAG